MSAEQYSGPLPHPDLLAKYNEAVPGAAERIIVMVEEQSRHRIAMERQVVAQDNQRSWGGLIAGASVAILFLAGSVTAILNGHAAAGGLIGTVDIVGLASAFIYGAKQRADAARQK